MATLKTKEGEGLLDNLTQVEMEKLSEMGVEFKSDREEGPGSAETEGIEIDDIEEEVEEEFENETVTQTEEHKKEEQEDPLKEQLKEMSNEETLGEEVQIPEWNMNDRCTGDAMQARRQASSLQSILQAKLQQERKSSMRYGTDEGTLETTEIASAISGDTNIRSKKSRPEKKSYSVTIVGDRSGSTGGDYGRDHYKWDRCEGIQRAMGQLAYALYDVGIDVCVTSLHSTTPTIEVPFGEDPRTYEDLIFSRESIGSTPLSKVIKLARANLEERGQFEDHIIFVICDGEPDKKHSYKEEIEKIDCPVVGVYVTEDEDIHGSHDDLFDLIRYATPEDVDKTCRELCEGLIGF